MSETRDQYLGRVNAENWGDRAVKTTGRPTRRPLSHVSTRDVAGRFRCPHCGGTTYTAKRPMARKVWLGILAVLTPKSLLQCVTCGATYGRG